MGKYWYARSKHLPGVLEKHREAQRKWRAANPDAWRKYYKTGQEANKAKLLLKRAKARAVQKELDFDLELTDIVIPDVCPIFQKPFDNGRYAASIDRIIPEKGYVKGNIRVISRLANSMKWDATPEELKQFCEGIGREIGVALNVD